MDYLSQLCSSLNSDDFRLLVNSMICLILFVIFFELIRTVLTYVLRCVKFFTSPLNYELVSKRKIYKYSPDIKHNMSSMY